jgi:hypothetical protein
MTRTVEEKLAGGKVGMNDAFAVDEHYGFYNFSCKPNAAFIRCIWVAL